MTDTGPEGTGEPGDETKQCPYCAETIKAAATKCRYCGSELPLHESSAAASGAPRRAGYCRVCGHNVWLTQSGACANGHTTQDITTTWMARKLVQPSTAKTPGGAPHPNSINKPSGSAQGWFTSLPTWAQVVFVLLWPISFSYFIIVMWKDEKFELPVRVILSVVMGGMVLAGVVSVTADDRVAKQEDSRPSVTEKAQPGSPTGRSESVATQQDQDPSRTQPNATALRLGQPSQGEYWQYTPKKVRRTSAVVGDFGTAKKAGSGQEYLLVYITVKNITNETQHTDFTFDPQPKVHSDDGQTYEYDSSNSYSMKDTERFEQAEDVAPGATQSGWLLFKIPEGKRGLSLKIEESTWNLGL